MARARLLAGAALTAATLTAVIDRSGALEQLELASVDQRYGLRAEHHPDGYLVVAVDDKTFGDLQEQWPFPRSQHARVIERIRAGGARAVGVDIQFTERTSDAEDGALADAIARARGTVLATTEVDAQGRDGIFGGGRVLQDDLGGAAGYAQVDPDADGAVRRVDSSTHGLSAFGLAVARAGVGRTLDAPRSKASVPIDFAGPRGTFPTVSYSDVLRGRVPRSAFADRIVLVGPSAPSLQDVHQTGVGRDALMSGVELQANITRTFVEGRPLHQAPGWLATLLGGLLAVVAPGLSLRLRPTRAAAAGLGAALAYLGLTVGAFVSGLILPLAAPGLGMAFGLVAAVAVAAMSAAYERERVHDLFARFVPAAVVGQVLARAGGDVRLGGEERIATVMFSDLRGFTSYAEQRHASAVIDVLNDYLGEMSDAILAHGGTLVSFMGDGIFAVFGAPLDQPDHADRALACARELVGPRLAAFNERLVQSGAGAPFRMGVGLNTGSVVSGNVGSEARLEYTAIGDTTNTAARIEGLTKEHGTMVLLAEATRSSLVREPEDLVALGDVPVRGRTRPLRLWALPDPA